MEPYADAGCVLAMDIDCKACKMTVMEVLSSIVGGYNVFIDAKAGIIKVRGEVDPNVLLHAILSRTGRHAKLVWAKLDGYNYHYGYGALFGYPTNYRRGCTYRTTLPEIPWRRVPPFRRRYGINYPFRWDKYFPNYWPFYDQSCFSYVNVPRSRFRCFGF